MTHLADCLRLENEYVHCTRITWSKLEGLCVLLRRLAYPCRLIDLQPMFVCPPPVLSTIVSTISMPRITPCLCQFSSLGLITKTWQIMSSLTVRPCTMCGVLSTKHYAQCVNLVWGNKSCIPGTSNIMVSNINMSCARTEWFATHIGHTWAESMTRLCTLTATSRSSCRMSRDAMATN